MLTYKEYYESAYYEDMLRIAIERVKNDFDLYPYFENIFNQFHLSFALYYTIANIDKISLLKYGKGKKQLKFISYKQYKNNNQ
jgi:hypothetical protein